MNTYSQNASLACSQCGQAFEAEIWLIVDTAGRPDLLRRARDGTLHRITCPHCGHEGMVDAPLLLYRPGQDPPLFFSPAQGTTAGQDREQAAALRSCGSRIRKLSGNWKKPPGGPGKTRRCCRLSSSSSRLTPGANPSISWDGIRNC
jgi:DNA-directed RNA polymerase subunit RPC12/RpoP